MNDSTDWEALIQKHLDGQTSTEEAEALSAQIVNDAEIRSHYVKAARVHGALADETLALDLETAPDRSAGSTALPEQVAGPFAWPRQVAAGLVAGLFVGLLGAGMVWAIGSPTAVARVFGIAHGDFESLATGPIPNQFPVRFGEWSGDPAEVSARADGGRELRFLETANISRIPNGPAAACDVFQLVDLRALRNSLSGIDPEAELTLELSARFRRDGQASNGAVRKITGVCHLYLFNAAPESIGKDWPLARLDAVAVGSKGIRLVPGQESGNISASCFLASEATVAVIHLAANPKQEDARPTVLGDCLVDDVQLTLISRPKLPVRVVQLEK